MASTSREEQSYVKHVIWENDGNDYKPKCLKLSKEESHQLKMKSALPKKINFVSSKNNLIPNNQLAVPSCSNVDPVIDLETSDSSIEKPDGSIVSKFVEFVPESSKMSQEFVPNLELLELLHTKTKKKKKKKKSSEKLSFNYIDFVSESKE